jgi:hypothetical protein
MRSMGLNFFAEHLSPGERLGELVFGLLMTLTFTIGAGVLVGTSEGASASLMYATIGCNVAWGIIDGALLVLQRMFDRGRLARLGRAIETTPDDTHALAIVAEELDETLGPISSEDQRRALYLDVVERVRASPRLPPRVTGADFRAALAVFTLVFFASFPAVLPYLLIDDAWVALRVSNALLIGVMFFVGYRWAHYTNFNPWAAAFTLVALGISLVLIAIPLGG